MHMSCIAKTLHHSSCSIGCVSYQVCIKGGIVKLHKRVHKVMGYVDVERNISTTLQDVTLLFTFVFEGKYVQFTNISLF